MLLGAGQHLVWRCRASIPGSAALKTPAISDPGIAPLREVAGGSQSSLLIYQVIIELAGHLSCASHARDDISRQMVVEVLNRGAEEVIAPCHRHHSHQSLKPPRTESTTFTCRLRAPTSSPGIKPCLPPLPTALLLLFITLTEGDRRGSSSVAERYSEFRLIAVYFLFSSASTYLIQRFFDETSEEVLGSNPSSPRAHEPGLDGLHSLSSPGSFFMVCSEQCEYAQCGLKCVGGGGSRTVYFLPFRPSWLETTRRNVGQTGQGGRGLERKEGMAVGEMKGVAVVIWSFNRLIPCVRGVVGWQSRRDGNVSR